MVSTIEMGILYLIGSLICGIISFIGYKHSVMTKWSPTNVTMELGIVVITIATIIGWIYWLIMAMALLLQ